MDAPNPLTIEGRDVVHLPVQPRAQEAKSPEERGNADRDKFDKPAFATGAFGKCFKGAIT